ncbi:uncharacterized protein LOC143889652 [Tasmannia lanceolata]|uniref:uncharacterized protein LOC143889652 n=1 Tax=Tasmannia lanceolata TaxID=3420 RepID=UPI00406358DD
MGNALSPFCIPIPISKSTVKLVFWEGPTRTLSGNRLAGEVMFQFPDRLICHADSFYIGHQIPALSIHDKLLMGETYFVIPVDRFPGQVLSTASLTALASTPKRVSINSGKCPFQYVKGSDGRLLMKVSPEFITRIISQDCEEGSRSVTSPICSTPELKKHYDQLVGSREQPWSPKLQTISECKSRLSPSRLLGLERR